ELRLRLRLRVVDVVLDGGRVLDRDELLLRPLGLLVRIVRLRDLDADALLEKGRDDHEDDQEHEADVHQRGYVDVALQLVAAAAATHTHEKTPTRRAERPRRAA